MKRRHIFNLVGCAIVALWLLMIGLLIKRVNFNHIGEATEVADKISNGKSYERDWMEIYLNDKKVGYSVNQVTPLGKDYLIQEEIFLKLNLMGEGSAVRTVTRSVVDDGFFLKSFRFRMTSGVVAFHVSGKVEGRRMHLKMGQGDTQRTQTIELSTIPVMGSGITQFFRGRKIEVGQSYRFPVFDPSTIARNEMIFKVVARDPIRIRGIEYNATRLETEMWGRDLTFWLDEDGAVLKEQGFMGLTLIKSSAAVAPRDISSGGDFYELASIDVNKDLHDPDRLKYLKLEIAGFDKGVSDWKTLNEGRQKFRDGMIEIAREEMPTRVNYSLPYPGQSEELKTFLKPEFNIESDDNVIKAKVREISGDLKDSLEAARRLLEWVYRNVQKRPVVTVPSALEVLRSRVGDCNEHAVLLAALLRASGIPARVCVGLVCARGKFFYHAWNEAYLGSWVSMDATLNQMPVDASHIKLLQGGLDKQVDIMGLIGKLRLKVISYTYD